MLLKTRSGCLVPDRFNGELKDFSDELEDFSRCNSWKDFDKPWTESFPEFEELVFFGVEVDITGEYDKLTIFEVLKRLGVLYPHFIFSDGERWELVLRFGLGLKPSSRKLHPTFWGKMTLEFDSGSAVLSTDCSLSRGCVLYGGWSISMTVPSVRVIWRIFS